MGNWGNLGSQTRDLWHRFFVEIQQPTAAFASGVSCPTMQFDPFDYKISDSSKHYKEYDQVVLSGGSNVHALSESGANLGGGDVFVTPQTRQGIWQEALRRLLFPSEFFRFGQDYLIRLEQSKPASNASWGAKLIWAVDASWWINMMFAATNIYPTWIPNSLGLVLDGAWASKVPTGVIPDTADLYSRVAPFNQVELRDTGWPYAVPYVTNPGELDSTGLLRNLTNKAPSFNMFRVIRFVLARPWWKGIETFAGFDGNRAQREDPNMDANLLRACMQHTFFHQNTPDLFTTLAEIERDQEKQRWLQNTIDKSLPAWINVMSSVPYWGLVRAGVDSWRAFAVLSLSVSQFPGQPQDKVRFPFTANEIVALKQAWQQAEESQNGLMALTAQLQTMLAIVQVAATGTVGRTQVNALYAWYQFATFRYNQPRMWERGWEIQPVLMRLVPVSANDPCGCIRLYPTQGGQPLCAGDSLADCDSKPDVRIYPGGKMGVHVDQALASIEQAGGFAISSGADVGAQGVQELERLSIPPRVLGVSTVRGEAPIIPPSTTPPSTGPYSLQNVSTVKRSYVLPALGLFSVALGGIILATRKGR